MIGVVVATHGDMADGIKSAAILLTGQHDCFATVGLREGVSPDAYLAQIKDAIDSVDQGDGVLAFVDLFGGTPSNSVCRLLGNDSVHAIAGVNLPMLLEALMSRDVSSIDELARTVCEVGAQGIVDLRRRLEETGCEDDEEEF
ncbi:MAG: PTS sugar transporter subunit IIA [Atopobiaceae bacterium]|nr:PTS sugar transporter subunit IIA [Atopobiaceae bacterium]